MNAQRLYIFLLILASLFLQACTLSDGGRYSIKQDSAPHFDYGDIDYQEPTPVHLPYNIWTSRPYEVLGAFYTPMQDALGFEDEGYASWYGQKFHGHKTATGEIFDMFALTAAHKTLPLPSFIRVTNLENNRTTTVKVNDRGPFHDDRILDLSYAAAKKLGFHENGVAKVKIEKIHVSPSGVVTIGKEQQATRYANNGVQIKPATPYRKELATDVAQSNSGLAQSTTDVRIAQQTSPSQTPDSLSEPLVFVQVAASSSSDKVRDLATGLSNLLQVPNSIPKVNNVYRLHLGPLENEQRAQKLIKDLKNIGFDSAFTVEFTPQ